MHLIIFIVLFAVVFISLTYVSLRCSKNIHTNFLIFARVLNTHVQYPFCGLPVYVEVKGPYKTREVSCRYFCFGNRPEPEVSMEPRIRIQKEIIINPTKFTQFSNGRIYYRYQPGQEEAVANSSRILSSLASRRLPEQDIIFFLEELTFAAKILESTPRS
jgi:hypothetical protein